MQVRDKDRSKPNMCSLYKFSLNLVDDAVLVLESLERWKSSKVVFVNASLEEKLGYTSGELCDKEVETHILIDELSWIEHIGYDGADTSTSYKGQATLTCKDTIDKRIFSFSAHSYQQGENGTNVYYVLVLRRSSAQVERGDSLNGVPPKILYNYSSATINENDESDFVGHSVQVREKVLTDMKDAQAEIQRLQNLVNVYSQYGSLLQNAPMLCLTINQHGYINYINRSPLPESKEELQIGSHLRDFVVRCDELMEQIDFALRSNEITTSIEAKLKTKEETWFNFHIRATCPTHVIIVGTDITKLKFQSEELKLATETKSRFLANMSHEVRTFLSGIIGMSELLAVSPITNEQREFVEAIQSCGEILSVVVSDVLDYSKIEAGCITLESSKLDLHKCMEDILRIGITACQKKKVELILDYDPQCPSIIFGDLTRIKQVLANLLNNSIKFTDSGYVLVSVTGKRVDNTFSDSVGEWNLEFSVKDTGCGIPRGGMGKLFKMFSQLDNSSTRKYQGTGVGLVVCKKLVHWMGGEIWAESDGIAGQGSVFKFFFRAKAIENSKNSYQQSCPEAAGKRIIVVTTSDVLFSVLQRKFTAMKVGSCLRCSTHDGLIALLKKESSVLLVFYDDSLLQEDWDRLDVVKKRAAVVVLGDSHPSPAFAEKVKEKGCLFLGKPMKDAALFESISASLQTASTLLPIAAKHLTSSPVLSRSLSLPQFPPLGLAEGGDDCVPPLSPPVHVATKKLERGEWPLKILVAEDNKMNETVITKMLRRLGCDVIRVAATGSAVIEAVSQELPDLIFMDVNMPGTDGIDCTRIIRKMPRGHEPFISAVTADAFPEDRNKCLSAGMDLFLTKPLKMELIRIAIHKARERVNGLHERLGK